MPTLSEGPDVEGRSGITMPGSLPFASLKVGMTTVPAYTRDDSVVVSGTASRIPRWT
jgi:hypothetical protein